MITPITTDDADNIIRASWPARRQDIDYTLHTSECFAPDDTVEGDDVAGLLLLGAMLGGAIVGLLWVVLS
jgi:hypothetical protein